MSLVIDLDAAPVTPYEGWEVVEHKGGGKWIWDPTKLGSLSLGYKRKRGRSDFKTELHAQEILNSNVLDFLLQNIQLIPEEWKEKESIFFFGTKYRFEGHICVRALTWDGKKWQADRAQICS